MSAVEMGDCKAKGLCMFCDEPFTPRHHLKHKRSQLFIVKANEDDTEEQQLTNV